MTDLRPNPDDLLQFVTDEATRRARGQLKIFFGACAGVGKTYAMLRAAAQRQSQGVEVGVGVVETHGREETGALLPGLAVLPPKVLSYRGRMLSEFDLDAALAAGWQLILVDELAHTNVAGSRHAKRWQDVEELLRAGIDVYTTLNVQHLDSLNDIVGGITGIRVRETVPDHVFESAADVVLVDLPPDDLLARLADGKVYFPDAAAQARDHFFRKGNLIALRELALRRVADRVNADVRGYRVSNAINAVWPTRERLLVCVSADPGQEGLVREGSRLAQRLQADCIVVHVDQPQRGREQSAREALLGLAKLAEQMGAEFANVPGEQVDVSLLGYARARNVTKIVVGYRPRRRWAFWRHGLSLRLAGQSPGIGLIVLRPESSLMRRRLRWPALQPLQYMRAVVLATLACGAATVLASLLLRVFDLSNVVMLFLLTVVFVALRLGRAAGAWAALLCVACLNFFFVDPRWSFSVSDTQYIFTFALMLVVAVVISQLAVRLSTEARVATAGERRAATLARVARDLSGAIKTEQIAGICAETIAPLLGARVALVLPDLQGHLLAGQDAAFVDGSVAQWTYDHAQQAGYGTQTLSGASALYLPLKAPMRVRGVLAVQHDQAQAPGDPDERRLLDACCSSIALALERIHFVEVAQDTLLRMEGERLRNALLAAVSHDLKTPLTAIRGLAETLERPGSMAPAQQSELAGAIRMQAEELQRLVANLLDLARMQSEGVRLNKSWNALDEIVGSALGRLPAAQGQRSIVADLPSDLPLVELDALLFERVLINLLDNARKYAGRDGAITIKARAAGTMLYLFVDDNGPGFPTADIASLFEPFVRGQRESSIPGVGLGLALCRSIVTAHGGSIHAENLLPHGARVEIRLALGAPPDIEQEEEV